MTARCAATLLLWLASSLAGAERITKAQLDTIIRIGREEGVPASVTVQLQIEESGDWRTGAWGDPKARSRLVDGYRSRGLFQLYEHPRNLNQLLVKFWFAYEEHKWARFDITNPVHNAKVALRYLAALHREYGSWYRACLFYNCGRVRKPPLETVLYAKRIINAK